MSSEGGITTVEHSGFTVTSNSAASPEALKESLDVGKESPAEGAEKPEKPDISKAASEMGKKGGEAAAKAKAKAAREAKKEAKRDVGEDAGVGRTDGDSEPTEHAEGDGSGEAEVDASAEKPDAKRDNPRHDAQARIRELAEERKAERARADRLEREAYEYRQRLEEIQRERQKPAQEAKAQPAEDAEPQEGDYENYADYIKAVARHEYKMASREAQKQAEVHQRAAAHVHRVTQTADAFKAALNKAAEADPEVREKLDPEVMGYGPSFMLEPGQRPEPKNWIADELLSAPERAPALLLYLSEHPAERQRLVALSSPREVTRELTRISDRLDAATAGTSVERRVSKANPPPTPVGGSPAVASGTRFKPGMSLDDYARVWKP